MSQANQPLAIAGVGMISCLGKGAEVNAAAMRCGYDGFQLSDQIIIGSKGINIGFSSISLNIRGISRLVELAKAAVDDLLFKNNNIGTSLSLIFCLSECEMLGGTAGQDRFDRLNKAIKLKLPKIVSASYGYALGRVSFIHALNKATELLYDKKEAAVLIVSVDSLVSPHELNRHLGSEDKQNRLLTETNSNGFVSGEAATAILISKPDKDKKNIQIIGTGLGTEKVDIYSTDNLKANGLIRATKKALNAAKISSAETAFRVASVSGEAYFFKELALTHSRTMDGSQSDHPLWHPADSIGETGAAIGGGIVVMAYYAFKKAYAIGSRAICHISNDDHKRGTFIIENNVNNGGVHHDK